MVTAEDTTAPLQAHCWSKGLLLLRVRLTKCPHSLLRGTGHSGRCTHMVWVSHGVDTHLAGSSEEGAKASHIALQQQSGHGLGAHGCRPGLQLPAAKCLGAAGHAMHRTAGTHKAGKHGNTSHAGHRTSTRNTVPYAGHAHRAPHPRQRMG